MSVERVLAAAAALREFTLDEIAAFCDEGPPEIVAILDSAQGLVERLDGAAEPTVTRWRVTDLDGLRRDLAGRAGTPRPGRHRAEPDEEPAEHRYVPGASSASRLLLAEQTLSDCATTKSVAERRILVATAKNHLRQIVAGILPEQRPWWSVELSLRQLGEVIEQDPDQLAATRLRLNLVLACLAEREATGRPVPARDLVDTVQTFQHLTAVLEDPRLHSVVGQFFDLVMAHLVPRDHSSVPAPGRLIAAVACRRVRAQVEHGVSAAMHALLPLLRNLGAQLDLAREQALYQVLGQLPDGRHHIVVYTDLLQILPRQYTWQTAAELLPGALVEAVTEPAATIRLARCAETLEQDLTHSPFGSDAALIGQAVHVFQDLADQVVYLDGTVQARSDRTRSELLMLAKAQVWLPVAESPGSPREETR